MSATQFIVLDMKKIKESNEIEVYLQVGESPKIYKIKQGKIGFSIPGELQNLMMQRAERCRNFGELVAQFYEGDDVVFPVDMSYF